MMENSYVVYMHKLETEAETKRYIGITGGKPEYRWNNGKGYKQQPYFWRAIQKYGWASFAHIILFSNLSKEQACLKERALIKLFKTQDIKFGFNISEGGDHPSFTDETKEKISKAHLKHCIDKEELCYQYIELNKTAQECAAYFGCSLMTINRNLVKYKIRKRKTTNIQKDKLIELYINRNIGPKKIAEYYDCPVTTVQYYLSLYGIRKCAPVNIGRDELYHQYVSLNKTAQECAIHFGCSRTTINRNLSKYNIKKHIKIQY